MAADTNQAPNERGYYLMDDTTQLFSSDYLHSSALAINVKLGMFVCLICHTGHTLDSCERHFEQHPGLKRVSKTLRTIASDWDITKSWPTLESILADYDPMLGVPRYEGIKISDRKACKKCPFTTKGKQTMREHYKTSHSGSPIPTNFLEVPTQQINAGAANPIFRVEPINTEPINLDSSMTDDLMKVFLRDNWTDYVSKLDIDSRRVTAWLNRTNWHVHVQGHDHVHLRNLVSLPDEAEFPGLRASVLAYANIALDEAEKFSMFVRKRLNTSDPSTGINHSPFQRPQLAETVDQYTVTTVHLVAALLRTSPSYHFPMSQDLAEQLDILRTSLSSTPPKPLIDLLNALHGVFIELWHNTYVQDTSASFPDPTICFLILHSIKDDGSFKEPKQLTHPLRHLIWFITLSSIHEMLALKYTKRVARISDALVDIDEYIREGRETTFSELWGLQHFASFYAFNTPTFPMIWWRDRPDYTSMLFKGQLFNLEHIHAVVRNLQLEMMDLYKKLCFGRIIRIDVNELHDDMSNSSVNFSFLNHPHNSFEKGLLFKALLSDPDIFAKCFYQQPSGEHVLLPSFTNRWLADLAKLELCLLGSFQILGGAPPRFTEVASTLMFNSPHMRRNVYAVGHQLGLVIQYTKTSHNKGRDSLIPHGLDSFGADILYNIHTVLRPFARYIINNTQPVDHQLLVKYATFVFMGDKKEISSEKYKDFFTKTFAPVIGWNLLPSNFRHVCIAYGRMHCDNVEHIEERITQEETTRALQSGHTHATERRIYGVDAESVGATDFNTFSRMLDVSVTFQLLFRAIPGGGNKWLTFEEAFCDNFDSILASDFLPPHIKHYISPLHRAAGTLPSLVIGDLKNRVSEVIDPIANAVAENKHALTQLEHTTAGVVTTTDEIQNAVYVLQQSFSRMENMMVTLVGGNRSPRQLPALQQTNPQVTDDTPSSAHTPSSKRSFVHPSTIGDVFGVEGSEEPPRKQRNTGQTVSRLSSPELTSPSASPLMIVTPSKHAKQGSLGIHPQSTLLTPSRDVTQRDPIRGTLGTTLAPSTPEMAIQIFRAPDKTSPSSLRRKTAIAVTTDISSDSPERAGPVSISKLGNHSSRAGATPTLDALATLRELMKNPSAVWRSEQQLYATEVIAKCDSDVVLLLRTGAGKSYPVIIAGLSNPGITVIVVHLRSILVDWARRLEELGISYEIFDPTLKRRPNGTEKFVLVVADRFTQPGFQNHMHRISATNFIRTVVLDEFHAWLPENTFRQRVFSHVDRLRFQPFQLVLMTATLPPVARSFVEEHAALHPNYKLISNLVIRPEIKLGVTDPLNVFKPADVDAWVALVHKMFESVGGQKPTDRMMIYCQSIKQLRQIKAKLDLKFNLDIPLYFTGHGGDTMSPEDQLNSLKRWRDGSSWIILCTNAFSAGVDERNVRIVFHYGLLRDFIDTVQEQDRAGRSGEDAFAFIIPLAKPPRVAYGQDSKWGGNVRGGQALNDTIYHHTTALPHACLNYTRATFFNGEEIMCSNVAAMHRRNWCTRCEQLAQNITINPTVARDEYETCPDGLLLYPRSAKDMKQHLISTFGPLSDEARHRIIKTKTDRDELLGQFEDMLAKLQDLCSACWAFNGCETERRDHKILIDCAVPQESVGGLELLRRILFEVRIEKGTKACYKCYASGMGSNRLHPNFSLHVQCPYDKELLAGLALVVFTEVNHRNGFVNFAKIRNWEDEDEFIHWLGQANERYHNNFMFIMRYFIEVDREW